MRRTLDLVSVDRQQIESLWARCRGRPCVQNARLSRRLDPCSTKAPLGCGRGDLDQAVAAQGSARCSRGASSLGSSYPRSRREPVAVVDPAFGDGMWHPPDGGACQGRPACRTATGWTRTTPSEAPPSLQWLATMYSVRPSSPPSMHEKQPRSAMTVSSTSPPSATRVHRCPGTLGYQIAPSASAQMPSGAEPGPRSAQTRRSTSSPESVIVQAVSLRDRPACRDGNVHDGTSKRRAEPPVAGTGQAAPGTIRGRRPNVPASEIAPERRNLYRPSASHRSAVGDSPYGRTWVGLVDMA